MRVPEKIRPHPVSEKEGYLSDNLFLVVYRTVRHHPSDNIDALFYKLYPMITNI